MSEWAQTRPSGLRLDQLMITLGVCEKKLISSGACYLVLIPLPALVLPFPRLTEYRSNPLIYTGSQHGILHFPAIGLHS